MMGQEYGFVLARESGGEGELDKAYEVARATVGKCVSHRWRTIGWKTGSEKQMDLRRDTRVHDIA